MTEQRRRRMNDSNFDKLHKQFISDEAPATTRRRRAYSVPSPRGKAPQNGRNLLQWIIEEADEQHQLKIKPARVVIGKSDVKALRYLVQWIDSKQREHIQ